MRAWGMQYPDGSQYTFDRNENNCFGGTIGPVPDAPALKSAEILEETGLPRVFDPAQAAEVDEVLDQTVAGGPTLPEFFALNEVATSEESAASWPNPPADHPANPEASSGGCNAGTPTTRWFAALVLLTLSIGLVRRREQLEARQ